MSRRRSQDGKRTGHAAPSAAGRDFAAHYQKAYRILWVIAAGIASPADAADIVQQASMQAYAKWDQFHDGSDFTAWMGQFVRYTALNHVRARRRAPASLEEQTDGVVRDRSASPASVRITEKGELLEDQQSFDDEVVHALNALAAVPRACLLLRTVQGMSYTEISRVLEIPEGTAMSHVHRSRQLLRVMLHNRSPAPATDQDQSQ